MGSLPVAVLLFKTQELGFAISSIPLFYMVYSVSFALGSWPAGRLVDLIGSGRVVVMGYLALIAAYAVLSISLSVVMLVVGFLLLGFFSACADGAQRSHISHIVPAEHRGAAYGYLNAAVGFGVLVAGVVGGYTWEYAGSGVALFAAVSVVFVGLVYFMSTLRAHPSSAR